MKNIRESIRHPVSLYQLTVDKAWRPTPSEISLNLRLRVMAHFLHAMNFINENDIETHWTDQLFNQLLDQKR